MKAPVFIAAVAGFLAGAVVLPGFASTISETFQLTPNQRGFIQEFDDAVGTKFLPIAETPAAVPFLKTALIACDNIPLQRQVLAAAGGSEAEIHYATDRFNRGFCGNS